LDDLVRLLYQAGVEELQSADVVFDLIISDCHQRRMK
jgi:hypothetical protein